MKRNRTVYVVVVCLLVVCAFAMRGQDGLVLTAGDHQFKPEIVTTAAGQQQGLSDRENLPKDAAMIFVFDKPDVRCFWMKDMRFALDIVWLNANKQVNAVEQNVQPNTYPASFCHVDAKYVVEFNAGTYAELGLSPGDSFKF